MSSILEKHLNWSAHEYNLKVNDGIAIVYTSGTTDMQIKEARQAFSGTPGVIDINFTRDEFFNEEYASYYVRFSRKDYFKAGIADIKEPQFFMSLLKLDAPDIESDITLASVGLGQSFGLYR